MPAKPVEHTWPVEYRKPSSSGNSPWKRCKAPCRLTVTVETGRRLRYEIYSNEKTYEEGWLNDSRLDVGNAGLTEDLQRTTIRIVTCPKDNTPTSSFCVTFNATAERDRAMTLLWPSCRGGAQTAPSSKKRPQHSIGKTPKRACPSTSMGPPAPRAARAPARDPMYDIISMDDDQLEALIRDTVEVRYTPASRHALRRAKP